MVDWSSPIKLIGILVCKFYLVKLVVSLKSGKYYVHNFFYNTFTTNFKWQVVIDCF